MASPTNKEFVLNSLSIDSQKVLRRSEINSADGNVVSLDALPKSQNILMAEVKHNLIIKIKNQCSKIFSGPWADPKSISVEQKTGGLSNYLYIASLNEEVQCPPDLPRKVLIRIYGEILRSNVDSVILDSIVFAILSEKKFGPTLHGVFSGGRIEQYIESRTLSRLEMRNPRIWPLIARKLAKFNSLPMPMNKTNSIIKTLGKFIEQIKSPDMILQTQFAGNKEIKNEIKSLPLDMNEERRVNEFLFQKATTIFKDFNLEEEYAWIRNQILDVYKDDFPTLFCHNDLQYNNILVAPNKKNEKAIDLLLIDFEYCSYNFRGFDIGNVINEWSLDYSDEHPGGFKYIPEAIAKLEERVNFVNHYLSESNSINEDGYLLRKDNKGLDYKKDLLDPQVRTVMEPKTEDPPTTASKLLNNPPNKMHLLEVQYGMLLSHFFWGAWSFVQGFISNIEFNYIGYAECRLTLYHECKKYLLENFDKEWAALESRNDPIQSE